MDGRGKTFALPDFDHPEGGRWMSRSTKEVSTPRSHTEMRGLLIVARDQLKLWLSLKDAFGDSEGVMVLLDRRQGDRRRGVQSVTSDRRRVERRSLPPIEDDLSVRKYVLVRPHYRRPND
jgi:hypothetical protein